MVEGVVWVTCAGYAMVLRLCRAAHEGMATAFSESRGCRHRSWSYQFAIEFLESTHLKHAVGVRRPLLKLVKLVLSAAKLDPLYASGPLTPCATPWCTQHLVRHQTCLVRMPSLLHFLSIGGRDRRRDRRRDPWCGLLPLTVSISWCTYIAVHGDMSVRPRILGSNSSSSPACLVCASSPASFLLTALAVDLPFLLRRPPSWPRFALEARL